MLERFTGPRRRPSVVVIGDRSVEQPLGEQRVVGLLGGLVALLSLLIGVLGGVVALLGAGVLGLPGLALVVKPGLASGSLLFAALLALGCLTLTITGRGQLRFECPPLLTEALQAS